MGVRSLPVQLGPDRAAWVASVMMIVPQLVVITLLTMWDRPYHAIAITVLVVAQAGIMRWFVQEPIKRALYLSAFGVPFYVSGMMITAFALRAIVSGAL
jgi:chlorophyll synthase